MSTNASVPTSSGTRKALQPARANRVGDLRAALFFIAPAAIGFTVFMLYPTMRGMYLSLTEYNLFQPPSWVGLQNYRDLWHDDQFWNSMKVTSWYVILNIAFQTTIAIGLAVLMHRLTKSALSRGSILLPYLIANVIVALLWFAMLDYQIGVVNAILDWTGLGKVAFFGSDTLAIPTIAFVNVWRHMGYTALLIFAGLQTIPTSVYEAAAVDGSSEWKTFWRITMPLLRPVLTLVLIITVTGSFQVFDTVAVTTKGGPGNASRVIQLDIYDRAFARSDFGYASAMSVILFLLLGGIAWAQNRFLRGGESDLA
jgi:multiple sugar transport system permease protein